VVLWSRTFNYVLVADIGDNGIVFVATTSNFSAFAIQKLDGETGATISTHNIGSSEFGGLVYGGSQTQQLVAPKGIVAIIWNDAVQPEPPYVNEFYSIKIYNQQTMELMASVPYGDSRRADANASGGPTWYLSGSCFTIGRPP
jgi:hypothetical protein